MKSAFFGELELQSPEPAKAKVFYQKLFGWKMEQMEIPGFGSRVEFHTEQGPGGAIMPSRGSQPSAWSVYLEVEDLKATVARVRELGGQVHQEPVEVPGEGALAVVADPGGAVFKLWQSKRAKPA